jgi:hypothetical protein
MAPQASYGENPVRVSPAILQVPSACDFSVVSARTPIALMQYDYTADYKSDFLMKTQGGGGIFVGVTARKL